MLRIGVIALKARCMVDGTWILTNSRRPGKLRLAPVAGDTHPISLVHRSPNLGPDQERGEKGKECRSQRGYPECAHRPQE